MENGKINDRERDGLLVHFFCVCDEIVICLLYGLKMKRVLLVFCFNAC